MTLVPICCSSRQMVLITYNSSAMQHNYTVPEHSTVLSATLVQCVSCSVLTSTFGAPVLSRLISGTALHALEGGKIIADTAINTQ